jgi:hypothetical protein
VGGHVDFGTIAFPLASQEYKRRDTRYLRLEFKAAF